VCETLSASSPVDLDPMPSGSAPLNDRTRVSIADQGRFGLVDLSSRSGLRAPFLPDIARDAPVLTGREDGASGRPSS
jgi:hypothetical protein